MGAPIWTKFGSLMQNNMVMAKWSRSKPEIEFQYGRRLFFKNESSYISAMNNWGKLTKFGSLIDFDLPKAVTLTNTKLEVVFSGSVRHVEKWIWRHIYATGAAIWTKFGRLIQNNMPITAKWSRSKLEVQFQYGGRLFFKTWSGYRPTSAVIWVMSRKFGLLIDFDFWRLWRQQIRNRK